MNIRIRVARGGEIELSPTRPPEIPDRPGSASYSATGPFGQILLREFEGAKISMLYHNMQFHDDEELTYIMPGTVIRLQIVLLNSYFYQSKFFGHGAVHERGIHFHTVPETHTVYSMRAGQSYSHLSIFYQPEHLTPLQTSFPRLQEFLLKAREGNPMVYNKNYSIAGARILALVDYMLEQRYNGPLQETYFSALAKDLLMESLLRIEDGKFTRMPHIGEAEVRRIYRVKEILLRDMHLPFSLSLLASEAGVGPFRLTREFKAIYGMGIKEYLLENRMKKAIRDLSATDMSVAAVASRSGYSTSQSFSLAFKNYFGCTPGSVHRRGRSSGENPH